jgi:hypothetical protein
MDTPCPPPPRGVSPAAALPVRRTAFAPRETTSAGAQPAAPGEPLPGARARAPRRDTPPAATSAAPRCPSQRAPPDPPPPRLSPPTPPAATSAAPRCPSQRAPPDPPPPRPPPPTPPPFRHPTPPRLKPPPRRPHRQVQRRRRLLHQDRAQRRPAGVLQRLHAQLCSPRVLEHRDVPGAGAGGRVFGGGRLGRGALARALGALVRARVQVGECLRAPSTLSPRPHALPPR